MPDSTPLLEASGPGVYTLDAGYVRPRLDSIHLVVDGGEAAFVDTAVNHSVPRMLAALDEAGLAPADVRWVLLTHIHLDHAGGAGQLMRHLPEAELVVHPRGAPHMADPEKLVAGTKQVYGDAEFERLYGDIPPVDPGRIRTVADGQTLELGGRTLEFLHTPGHALHHVCIHDPAHRLVFTGDTFGISYREFDTEQGAFIFPAATPTHFDPDQAHDSVDRITALQPEAVYLTHYSRVTDIGRLAADLHDELDALVGIARGCEAEGEARVEWLRERIGDHLLRRVRAHGCRLDDREVHALLEMDVGLNAQGVAVWMQRAGH